MDRGFAADAVQRLAALYGQAEQRIVSGLADRLSRGLDAAPDWVDQRMREVGAVRRWAEDQLSRVVAPSRREVRAALAEATDTGARLVSPRATTQGTVYSGLRAEALDGRLRGAERLAADAAARAYRSAVLAGGLELTGTGSTNLARRRSVQRALNQAVQQGITGFTDRTGRRWSLAGYVEMAAQTAATQAALDGQLAQMGREGLNLIIISSGPQECERCRRWMGKVLTRDSAGEGGATLVLPAQNSATGRMVTVRVAGSLSEALRVGLFHPRCRCRAGVYRPGLTGRPPVRPDPEGQAARDRLRALERRIRELKMREAAALDDEARKAATSAVRLKQKELRDHVAENAHLGIRRDQRRERVDLGYHAVP